MVTAELAAAFPALVLVIAVAVGGVGAGIDQIRCVDAARLAARALARGDPQAAVVATARSAAPAGARIAVSATGSIVTVSVSVRRELPAGAFGLDLAANASADREVGT